MKCATYRMFIFISSEVVIQKTKNEIGQYKNGQVPY